MKFLRLILCFTLSLCVIFTIFFARDKISKNPINKVQEYKGIITIWHVDSFQGGIGSRRQFLLKVAKQFEKENNGVLVMVINHTVDSVNEMLSANEKPDIISYGVGVNVVNPRQLKFSSNAYGGNLNDKTYAVCWCRGGYVLIENLQTKNNDNNLIISQGKNNLSTLAYLNSNLKFDKVEMLEQESAYEKFILGKCKYLLATQRELHRLKNRNIEVKVTPLGGYNDLLQYLSILTNDNLKYSYSNQFINYLMSKKVQKELHQIGLMSCVEKVNFNDEIFNQMQNINKFKTLSAFLGKSMLENVNQFAIKGINNDKESIFKIKNMLI